MYVHITYQRTNRIVAEGREFWKYICRHVFLISSLFPPPPYYFISYIVFVPPPFLARAHDPRGSHIPLYCGHPFYYGHLKSVPLGARSDFIISFNRPLPWCSHFVFLACKYLHDQTEAGNSLAPSYKTRISTIIVIVYTGNLTMMAAAWWMLILVQHLLAFWPSLSGHLEEILIVDHLVLTNHRWSVVFVQQKPQVLERQQKHIQNGPNFNSTHLLPYADVIHQVNATIKSDFLIMMLQGNILKRQGLVDEMKFWHKKLIWFCPYTNVCQGWDSSDFWRNSDFGTLKNRLLFSVQTLASWLLNWSCDLLLSDI